MPPGRQPDNPGPMDLDSPLLIGAGGAIMFKGSGFYKTDYRSESYKKGAAADKGGGSDGAGKKSDSGGSSGGSGSKGSE